MAGIYIHIPFCKSRCGYCDFYSTTLLQKREQYVRAMLEEIHKRAAETTDKRVNTIYMGGGTPSLLEADRVKQLSDTVYECFDVAEEAEFTIEANPNDINETLLTEWRNCGINRLSMGVQSFSDADLQRIGRRHTAAEAIAAVAMAQDAGFDNISIDLIYALPDMTLPQWQQNIEQALSLQVQHISTYCLTYEVGTPFYKQREQGLIKETTDELANEMYQCLIERLAEAGFEHYEVSNFAKAGRRSRHNSAYWDMTPYIGIGAAAHSYDGLHRRWNISDLSGYIDAVNSHQPYFEMETLTETDHYNELLMLSLRTCEGLDLNKLNDDQRRYCLHNAESLLETGHLTLQNEHLIATRQGLNILDMMIERLMQ